MNKSLIAAAVLGAGMTSTPLLAQGDTATDSDVGKQVYALVKVEKRQIVGVISDADNNAFRVRIGEQCIGLPRQEFTEQDGQYASPWPKDALEGTIKAGNPEDFVCAAPVNQSDPAVGKQIVAMQEMEERQIVGTVQGASGSALRIQIGEHCIGLPRQEFTEQDGQFVSPWAKDALEGTIKAGNPKDFVCPA